MTTQHLIDPDDPHECLRAAELADLPESDLTDADLCQICKRPAGWLGHLSAAERAALDDEPTEPIPPLSAFGATEHRNGDGIAHARFEYTVPAAIVEEHSIDAAAAFVRQGLFAVQAIGADPFRDTKVIFRRQPDGSLYLLVTALPGGGVK